MSKIPGKKRGITIEALSIFMGLERREPWPIFLIEKWIVKNRKHFSDELLYSGRLTERQALITAIGCYLDSSYDEAERLYGEWKQRLKTGGLYERREENSNLAGVGQAAP